MAGAQDVLHVLQFMHAMEARRARARAASNGSGHRADEGELEHSQDFDEVLLREQAAHENVFHRPDKK